MQRATASLLIALVALMALLPQAMCPCSTLARAHPERVQAGQPCGDLVADAATRTPMPACCPLCLARLATAAAKAPRAGSQEPSAPAPCPCCMLNGKGKLLVLRGEVVRPDAPVAAEFVVPSASVAWSDPAATALLVRPVVPDPWVSPPSVLRAGVVLLI